jgi:tetratricopeptide (TPR) repeat protein
MRKYRKCGLPAILLILAAFGAACAKVESGAVKIAESDFPAIHGDVRVTEARAAIEKSPASSAAYLQAASAYINAARRSGDFSLNSHARKAVEKALRISPTDIQGLKLKASLHLTYHEFAAALKLGDELTATGPPDSFLLGVLTDAHTQLGNYPEAVESAQRMVDAKPNSQSYSRAAILRGLHGDTDGAAEMFKLAARTADPADKEAQAWTLSQLGELYWRNGRFDDAERVYDEALSLVPDYYLAAAGKGRVRAAKGDLAGAASLLSGAVERSPHTGYAILLGDVYKRLGKSESAKRLYALADNSDALGDFHDSHRVALHWADSGQNLDRALEIAEADYAGLKDVYASDILAWCLYKKGRFQEARARSSEAMRIGTKDAVLFYHAGMIELALGNRDKAKQFLRSALELNPSFDLIQSEVAKLTLAGLG